MKIEKHRAAPHLIKTQNTNYNIWDAPRNERGAYAKALQ